MIVLVIALMVPVSIETCQDGKTEQIQYQWKIDSLKAEESKK